MKLKFTKKPLPPTLNYVGEAYYLSQLVDPLDASMPYQCVISRYRNDFPGESAGMYEVTAKYMWEKKPKNKDGFLMSHDYLGTFKYLADAKAAAQQHIDKLSSI
ncbi:MAG: hypothetical protein ACPHAN_15420 [Pseudomonadales bacterium]